MKIQSDFYNNQSQASSFLDVQRAIYPELDLQWALDQGLLLPQVTPFAVVNDEGQAVSILNASRMNLKIEGKDYQTLQIGTVATLPPYRGQGLAALLQKHVLEAYSSRVDFIFLFANSSVLDFYPKFGFKKIPQTSFRYFPTFPEPSAYSKLVLDTEGVNILKQILSSRENISNTIEVKDSAWLVEFYCRTAFADALWIDNKGKTILVATIDGQAMDLHDIITNKLPSDFFKSFAWNGVTEIRLGFTPDRFDGFFRQDPGPTDEQMFVIGSFPEVKSPFWFPMLGHT